MNKVRKRFVTTVWYCCLIGVVTLGLVSIVGTGGSDDDGGGGSDILPVYNFTINMDKEEGIKPGPLSVAFDSYVLEASGIIEGSMNTGDGGYTISDTTSVSVSDVGDPTLFDGGLSIAVTADIVIPDDGPPTSGGWTVQSGEPVETITVTVVVTPDPGVTITTDDEMEDPDTVTITWEQLDALMGGVDVPLWQQKASFVSGFFQFMLDDQTPFIADTFGIIDDHDDVFEDSDGKTPDGVDQEGYNDFTWFDVEDDDSVGPGDSFEWTFVDCWNDDLFNGEIALRGYTNDEEGGITTLIGYKPSSLEAPGGVEFIDFEISEIRYEVEGPYTIGTVYTLNGGFTIVFFEPED
ncbi:MAG: hypothetical protein JRC86_13385 [Deltaproteobacteria bacterium]|nr:hypothetical protein [Deltaproteobacteria bacterium]